MFKVLPHSDETLIWWYHQREFIDMAPVYQRESGLWSTHKQAFLIDSIINDYDIPKLYLADFRSLDSDLNSSKQPYAVIDGKQRLQAIYAFFDDRLKLNSNFEFADDPSRNLKGLTYYDLKRDHPDVAAKVEYFRPVVMSVVTDTDSKIGELFVRLNSGISVNGAEKRNAMPGLVPALIRSIAQHKFFRKKIKFSILRMAEFNVSAKLLMIEFRGKFADTKAANLDAFVDLGDDPKNAKKLKEAKKAVGTVLDQMALIFRDRDPILSAGGSIPVYFWLVRNFPKQHDSIRDFLELFAHLVHDNQQRIKQNPADGEPELSSYYTMVRTTNDQASLIGRYEILKSWFEAYLAKDLRFLSRTL